MTSTAPTTSHGWLPRKKFIVAAILVYAVMAGISAWYIGLHSETAAKDIEQILTKHVLKNEASQFLEGFGEEHPFLDFFFSDSLKDALKLPSPEAASKALDKDVPRLLEQVRLHSAAAAWWTWTLVALSLAYVVSVILAERSFVTRPVIFALTCVSLVSFGLGVLTPAMVIWTAPSLSIGAGKLAFVLQDEVRGIWAIIHELFRTGHWVISGFLFLFSIVTPFTKAMLTFFVTLSPSRERNAKIGKFLHSIGKWSMADVFVAGVLLSLYALKAQEATKSIPCLGLYYFIGYCILSMVTTEILTHSEAAGGEWGRKAKPFGRGTVAGLLVFLAVALAGTAAYANYQYPLVAGKHGAASSLPERLNGSGLGPKK
ncbi:MAG TPA: paraquat-inducible protein A [Candidatus Methylacidiphilales bacterium]